MAEAVDGKFAQMFNEAMTERSITMKQLAANSEWQYESFRKLARGYTTPSKDMLSYLHKMLGIDIKKAELAAAEDKARRNGMWRAVAQAADKNPELDPIEKVWRDLTENDKRELIAMAQMKAQFNRQHPASRRRSG